MKQLIKQVLGYFGYEIRKRKRPWEMLADFPIEAETIIDVGIHQGTPRLYEAFPEAYLLLIDPLDISREYAVNHILDSRRGKFVQTALDEEQASTEMKIYKGAGASTFNERSAATKAGKTLVERSEVQTRRLDSIMEEVDCRKPYGLKIDTEGHELNVLKGAENTLQACDFVIAETAVHDKFEDAYELVDLLSFLNEHSFEVYTILQANPNMDGIVRGMDVLFSRK